MKSLTLDIRRKIFHFKLAIDGRAHQQNVASAKVPDPARLDHRGDAAHQQREENHPVFQAGRQPRCAQHNRRRQHDAGNDQRDGLGRQHPGQAGRRIFIDTELERAISGR